MASLYSSLCSEGDMLPTSYLVNPKFGSAALSGNQVYVNQPSGYPNCSESAPQYHALSLSLGSEEPSLLQLHSDLSQYTNSSLYDPLLVQDNHLKNVQYLSFDLAARNYQDTVKYGAENIYQNLNCSKETSFIPFLQQQENTPTLSSSKYHKAAQDLLDELVNVCRVPKLSENVANMYAFRRDRSIGEGVKMDGASPELQEFNNNDSHDLLQNKLAKLLSFLDEVDRRYKQYRHQMQAVASSFDTVAGRGAALPYTTLALRTISRHFRCLRDAIKKQIQAAQKSLGDKDLNSRGAGVLSRLRYVDRQLRQQKAVEQYGGMRQPWRPQRGLPETAVSVLRAWLFEHFLNPYPKETEKIVLAREAGLTRGQVANWFINARVRLWKPMIEEMYKEEFGEAETEPGSSSAQGISAFDDKEEVFSWKFNVFSQSPSSAE